MNVVYAVTGNYIDKIIPSLKSLLHFHPEANVYLVTEVDEVDLPVSVINISGQKWFEPDSVNYRNRYTYINLIKVCYPSILPVDKVLHLDADTIICDSLDPFYDVNLEGKWVAAVDERLGRYHPFGDNYFNMGVAVINLDQMRRDNIEPVLVEYLNSSKQPFADQDAWNRYGIDEGKFISVPVRFNENFATGTTDEPAIVHYCGDPNWFDCPRLRAEYLKRWKVAPQSW